MIARDELRRLIVGLLRESRQPIDELYPFMVALTEEARARFVLALVEGGKAGEPGRCWSQGPAAESEGQAMSSGYGVPPGCEVLMLHGPTGSVHAHTSYGNTAHWCRPPFCVPCGFRLPPEMVATFKY